MDHPGTTYPYPADGEHFGTGHFDRQEYDCDILVVGAGPGGYAAALSALSLGSRVILTERFDRIGGQITSQAVPPDEHPWIEYLGCTRTYRQWRDSVRQYYRDNLPLTAEARQRPHLNPGDGCVSQLCHEPLISQRLLEDRLRPYLERGMLQVFLECQVLSAETSKISGGITKITSLTFKENDHPERQARISARFFIDSSETGELWPLTGAPYSLGSESRAETGELHAPEKADPRDQQAISWCFIISHDPQQPHVIERPASYDYFRRLIPALTPPWGGPLLSWQATHPITLEPVVRSFDPLNPRPERGPMDLWTFRRIARAANFQPGAYPSDIVLVNWPQIDYLDGSVLDVSPQEEARTWQGARELSLSMLYWMQTEAPRADGGQGWPGLKLRPDITGTPDGLAAAPYIREARRLKGFFTIKEQHVGLEARMLESGLSPIEVRAASFPDSVGIGAYRIDLHPSISGRNYVDVSALPFQIPLGALICPSHCNLLAGGKGLSVTHITNGCYRLHPVEWNAGEAAGACAAYCLRGTSRQLYPEQVYRKADELERFQQQVLVGKLGIQLAWPEVHNIPDPNLPPIGPL